jgi:cell division protein FtsZ
MTELSLIKENKDMLNFDCPKGQSAIIKVIGVGGGGNNAVNYMFQLGIVGVDFVNCNTDLQALEASPVPNVIRFGSKGTGAGNNPEQGRKLAEESADEIRSVLDKNTEMIFITAGMGGGTGTGAAPVIAAIAQEMGILTVAIVTEPFTSEGKRRQDQARQGIDELRKLVDVLLVIKNDKLREQYGDLKVTEAYKKADNVLANAVKGIAEIITVRGYVNVDLEDVKTVMRYSGTAIMGMGIAEGEDRAARVVDEALNSPLLNNIDIRGSQNLLIYITYGDNEIRVDEMDEITELVHERTGNNADLILGHGYDESLGESIAVSIIATGFNMPKREETIPIPPDIPKQKQPEQPERKTVEQTEQDQHKIVHSLNEEVTETPSFSQEPITIRQLIPEPNIPMTPAANRSQENLKTIVVDDDDDMEYHISEQPNYVAKCQSNISPVAVRPTQETSIYLKTEASPMDDLMKHRNDKLRNFSMSSRTFEVSETIMEEPAFRRRNIQFEPANHSSESHASNYHLFPGEDGKLMFQQNQYLHDNVD